MTARRWMLATPRLERTETPQERLAGAVLRLALVERDQRFFAGGPSLRFWCEQAGLREADVLRLARRTFAAGTGDDG